jgi:hypothetical protein
MWWMLLGFALAQDDESLEIEVIGDRFARFRDTRWRVDTQIGLPFPAVMYGRLNGQVEIVAADVRLVVTCKLDGEALRRRALVRCQVEDAGLTLSARQYEPPPAAQSVLAEMDAALTGLAVELHVADDGRVLDVGVLGEVQSIERVNAQNENVRQLVMRALLGFHIAGPDKYRDDQEWIERDSRLMALPRLTWLGQELGVDGTARLSVGPDTDGDGGEVLGRGFTAVPPGVDMAHISVGQSTVLYRVDLYKGQYVVQGAGQGSVNVGSGVVQVFSGPMTSVGVYDRARGFVTERRWTVNLEPAASSSWASSGAGFPYWQLGSLSLLGPDEVSDVGASVIVPRPR